MARVLIVPDKFKGTLTAHEAAELIALGWRRIRPADQLDLLPMSDGGDGFGPVLSELLGMEERRVETVDAAGRPISAAWWWNSRKGEALIETARVIGLALLPPGQFHPFDLDTTGLGALIRAVVDAGAIRCVAGIGGSATNDGGFGMARALEWRFLREDGGEIERWTDLSDLNRIIAPEPLVLSMTVAVDVQNPLLGEQGATRVYGPQKGIVPSDVDRAEKCLGRLAEVAARDLGIEARELPGTGAAGGLGFGLRCFLGARLSSGFRLFADYARLSERIRNADCVITGEGAMDASTLMGKGVGEVGRLCLDQRVHCIGLAGKRGISTGGAPSGFSGLLGMHPDLTTPEEALERPQFWLPKLAERAAAEWRAGGQDGLMD